MTFSAEQKQALPAGTPVLNVHIQQGAHLVPAEVDRSFRLAEEFFPRYFPEHRAKAYLCYSWLLYPGLRKLLQQSSNILHFAERFRLIGQAQDPYESDAIRRIYGKRYKRKCDYPQETSLQRNALGNFRYLGEGCGMIEIT